LNCSSKHSNSSFQSPEIDHLVKKSYDVKGGDSDDAKKENGEIDDIYQFLENAGNYYISLLVWGPTCGQDTSTDPSGKSNLFNETWIGKYTGPFPFGSIELILLLVRFGASKITCSCFLHSSALGLSCP
jgi:hypothetical protein